MAMRGMDGSLTFRRESVGEQNPTSTNLTIRGENGGRFVCGWTASGQFWARLEDMNNGLNGLVIGRGEAWKIAAMIAKTMPDNGEEAGITHWMKLMELEEKHAKDIQAQREELANQYKTEIQSLSVTHRANVVRAAETAEEARQVLFDRLETLEQENKALQERVSDAEQRFIPADPEPLSEEEAW